MIDSPSDRRAQRKKVKMRQPSYSELPGSGPGLVVTDVGDEPEQPVRYFVYADVLEELVKAARYRSEHATAVLLGEYCVDRKGPFVEVTAFCDLQYLYGGDSVELTQPTVRELLESDRQEGAAKDHIVGVFAARPGGGGHLDEETARLHLSLFNVPFQVAVVIDGVKDRLGLYARAPGERFFNAAFSLVDKRRAQCDVESNSEQKTQRERTGDDDRDHGFDGEGNSGQPGKSHGGV